MSEQGRRAVWWLGLSQCVLWGILYYGYSIWQEPLIQSLHVSRIEIAGAFSLGLAVMALLAPYVGRQIDAGEVQRMVRWGLLFAILGIVGLTQSRMLWSLYLSYALLGAAMATLLYETAFGLVTRAVSDHRERLSALSTITIFGGLASTVFLPLLAWSTSHFGWRMTGWATIPFLLASGVLLEKAVYPYLLADERVDQAAADVDPLPLASRWQDTWQFSVVFILCTVSAMTLAVLLIPKLHHEGASAIWAASALGVFGVAQLPGRIWLSRMRSDVSATWLTTVPLSAMLCGMIGLALAPGLFAAFLSVALFGFGSGLMTLARPWLVQRRFGVAQAGRVNGRIAKHQGVARAMGPIGAVWLADLGHFDWVFAGFALAILLVLPLAGRLPATAPASV